MELVDKGRMECELSFNWRNLAGVGMEKRMMAGKGVPMDGVYVFLFACFRFLHDLSLRRALLRREKRSDDSPSTDTYCTDYKVDARRGAREGGEWGG